MNLDAPERFGTVDPADALGDVERYAAQWSDARALAGPPLDLAGVDAVVVAGMGGSGITGDVVWALARRQLRVPVVVHKDYGLPAFVGPRTLVAAASYSGTTEETLDALERAGAVGARRWLVTAGEELAASLQGGVPVVVVPGGCQPRHALGWLAVPLLMALGLDDGLGEAVEQLGFLGRRLGRSVPQAENPAKAIAARLAGAQALVLGAAGSGAVAAYRLRCQLAENAKTATRDAVLPEADHNEVVAWDGGGPELALLVRDPAGEDARLRRRFAATAALLPAGAWRGELRSSGRTPLARLASLLLQADLISVYTALARDVDPTPIRNIDRLKAALARGAT